MNKHIIITGHYGSGKTNVAVNLALSMAHQKQVYLIDIDIVNPYFRSADNKQLLEDSGVRVITPLFANTNLDIPALPAEIQSVFIQDCIVVWDVGGDSDGAVALGRYSDKIIKDGYSMYNVVNFCRPLSDTSDKIISIMNEIDSISRLKTTGFINNTNIGEQTDMDLVCGSEDKISSLCSETGLPLVMTCIPEFLHPENGNFFVLKMVTKKYW